MYKPKWKCGKL